MKNLYLYGASGHGKVVAEIAEENGIVIKAFIDQDPTKVKVLDYPVIQSLPEEESITLVISIGNNRIRQKIAREYINAVFPKLIHPGSNISKRSIIGEGSVVMAGASINCNVMIGKHVIINTNASVDHDCKIADFVHISPNAILAGEVEVGVGTHIGVGACIIPQIKIGRWCTIGAGAVVLHNVPDGATVVGNPGRILKIREDL